MEQACVHVERDGGQVLLARERGIAALQDDLDELAALSKPGFIRGHLEHLLNAKA